MTIDPVTNCWNYREKWRDDEGYGKFFTKRGKKKLLIELLEYLINYSKEKSLKDCMHVMLVIILLVSIQIIYG